MTVGDLKNQPNSQQKLIELANQQPIEKDKTKYVSRMMFFTLSLPLLINSVRQKFSATQNRHRVGKFEESHCTYSVKI